ncbi:putative proline/betaine transporter [Rickettsia endosymbiont of Ixodes pacificus]|nr:putative proline/betaine transporter [Rickettsia endosymbiont of Ixodes pacificus]
MSVCGWRDLAVASFVTSNGLSWRYAFLAGAFIAVIGTVARKALRETADFANAKKQLKKLLEQANIDRNKLKNNPIWQQKVNLKTFFALFLIDCTWPVCFYFLYFYCSYCSNILKTSFGYSTEEVIHHNFWVSIVHFSSTVIFVL